MLLFMLALPLPFKGASAHEVRPAVADITVTANAVELRLSFNAEALLAGINLDGLADTDEADNVADYDRLRALSAEELATRVGQAWSEIDENIRLELGFSDLPLALLNVEIVAEPNPELPRETIVNARAPLPAGETPIIIGWAPEYGVLIVRQVDGAAEADALYTGLLTSGASSDPIPRSATATATATRSPLSTMSVAIQAGLQHVILSYPHIVFVVGLFFLSTRWQMLFWQAGAFTAGHLVALAVSLTGLVSVAHLDLDPFVAAAIIFVAIENIFANEKSRFRLPFVFLFALVHGLSLAFALSQAGLSQGQLIMNVFGFNLGIELGQILIFIIAILLIGIMFADQPWYRKYVAIPASVIIAIAGGWFLLESTVLA